MISTVEGVYKKGKVIIFETPIGIDESPVLVTFLPKSTPKPSQQQMVFGQFIGNNMSTEEDFHIAEWRGEGEKYNGNEEHH
jgi:hypothetical protein